MIIGTREKGHCSTRGSYRHQPPRYYFKSIRSMSSPSSTTDRQQGVLWKRRDVFKYRWRPRWFVLHPDQGVLTYYLLTANVSEGLVATPNSSSSGRRASDNADNSSSSNPLLSGISEPSPSRTAIADRSRTFSMDSQVSENTVDYDVVPRGTLDLRGGCTVTVNDRLSKASDHFFAFTQL